MRVWYFIAYAYSCFLNMHGHEPSGTRSLNFDMPLYLHPFLQPVNSIETVCMCSCL